ncbi:PrgI family protein [Candidatus Saccharibacteria bacterium]|nr:PrgI family protein [Candidatus Saccharibacteria bacterium]
MAQYKVPQDVEADDKLIGPFSFRQFVYLLIAGGLIALAVGLFQIFPVLVIIPLPFILLLLALALPLKKDQPMETYLAAVLSYYLKPRNRVWTPGQRESTIDITAPKAVDEEDRSRQITGDEVTHRLSFLADIVDTEGRAIDDINTKQVNEDLVIEANTTNDMFETGHFDRLETTIAKDENERHETVLEEMRQAIVASGDQLSKEKEGVKSEYGFAQKEQKEQAKPISLSQPVKNDKPVENSNVLSQPTSKKEPTIAAKPSIIELANNADFSIATIAKEANRMKEKEENEVYISLH